MAFITDNMVVEGGMTANTFSALTYTNLPSFTGGTVTGATRFTGGLTASTISATSITGTTLVKSGGTSSEFLMANGSVIATGQTPGALIASIVSTSSSSQALTNTSVTITFDTDELVYGTISRTSSSGFTVTRDGLYMVSLQPVVVVNNNTVNTFLWLQKNGVNVPRSAMMMSAINTADIQVLPLAFTVDLVANDQLVFKGTTSIANGSTLTPVVSGATVPAVPSIMVDIKGWKK